MEVSDFGEVDDVFGVDIAASEAVQNDLDQYFLRENRMEGYNGSARADSNELLSEDPDLYRTTVVLFAEEDSEFSSECSDYIDRVFTGPMYEVVAIDNPPQDYFKDCVAGEILYSARVIMDEQSLQEEIDDQNFDEMGEIELPWNFRTVNVAVLTELEPEDAIK